MKLLVASMIAAAAMSMGIFVGAFQACTNSANVAEDTTLSDEVMQLGDAASAVNIVDVDVLDVVPAEELVDASEEVEVLVFTEEETYDVLYSDTE